MKAAQASQFEEDYKTLAKMSKAIAHPARIAILKWLMENNNQTCKAIVEQLPFSQSTVSQHLAELKSAGFIEGKSYRTSMIYSIDQDALKSFNQTYQEVFKLQTDRKQLSLF